MAVLNKVEHASYDFLHWDSGSYHQTINVEQSLHQWHWHERVNMTNERHIIFYSGLLIFLQHNIILNGNPNGLLHSMKPLFYLNTQYFIILRLVNIFFSISPGMNRSSMILFYCYWHLITTLLLNINYKIQVPSKRFTYIKSFRYIPFSALTCAVINNRQSKQIVRPIHLSLWGQGSQRESAIGRRQEVQPPCCVPDCAWLATSSCSFGSSRKVWSKFC